MTQYTFTNAHGRSQRETPWVESNKERGVLVWNIGSTNG